jgi:hypothetical protein
MVIAIVAFVAQRIGGVSAVNAFFYPGTIGVLSMLVTYIVVNVGALRFLFLGRRVRAWEAIVPVVALAILVYVIYANVYPVPDFPFNIFPYVVAAWLILGLGIVLFVPGLARRIGANLAERERRAPQGGRSCHARLSLFAREGLRWLWRLSMLTPPRCPPVDHTEPARPRLAAFATGRAARAGKVSRAQCAARLRSRASSCPARE